MSNQSQTSSFGTCFAVVRRVLIVIYQALLATDLVDLFRSSLPEWLPEVYAVLGIFALFDTFTPLLVRFLIYCFPSLGQADPWRVWMVIFHATLNLVVLGRNVSEIHADEKAKMEKTVKKKKTTEKVEGAGPRRSPRFRPE